MSKEDSDTNALVEVVMNNSAVSNQTTGEEPPPGEDEGEITEPNDSDCKLEILLTIQFSLQCT